VCCWCGPLGSWLAECKKSERRRRAASCTRPACLRTAVRYVRCTNSGESFEISWDYNVMYWYAALWSKFEINLD
jgi:hypothetical protein